MMSNFKHALKYMLLWICFFSITLPIISQQEMSRERTFTFKKGKHHATKLLNNRFLWHAERLNWQTRFDSSARYILLNRDSSIDVDQYDWSKLHGMTFTPLHPLRNTAMVGWRYNLQKDSIELIPYFHIGGKRFFRDEPHLTVGINEPFEHEIYLNYYKKIISITITTARDRLIEKRVYKTFRPWAMQIHPFFGGNKRAPRNIKLNISFQKTKRTLKYYEKQ